MWCEFFVVGFAVDDGNGIQIERPEQPLADEIGAERVLQRQDEFVVPFDDCIAFICGAAVHRAAFPVNIHVDVLGQLSDEVLSLHRCPARR